MTRYVLQELGDDGTPLPPGQHTCHKCRSSIGVQDRFCQECGAPQWVTATSEARWLLRWRAWRATLQPHRALTMLAVVWSSLAVAYGAAVLLSRVLP